MLGIGLVGVLLAGCVAGPDRGLGPTPQPGTEQPGATPLSSATSSPTTTASSSSGSATVGPYDFRPLPEYTGPQPLPASDGKPMLWPLETDVSVTDYSGYRESYPRYGFLDVTGKLVIPQRYESYQYCSDDSGRPVLLIANRGGDARGEVFDLSGKRLAKLPTERGDCAGPSYVITTNDGLDEASTQADVQNGLLELATGKWLIRPIKGRQLTSLRPGLINVTEPKGEYFLNLNSGRKVRHPGWVTWGSSLAAGESRLPARTKRDGGKVGLLDLDGHWMVAPTSEDVRDDGGGVTVLQRGDEDYVLIDKSGRQLPGTWSQVDEVLGSEFGFDYGPVLGYLVTGGTGQALFTADGREVIAPGLGGITCESDAGGACTFSPDVGDDQLVNLPEGTASPLPSGFSRAISAGFLGSARPNDEDSDDRILALTTGITIETIPGSVCAGAGPAFVHCGSETGPGVVIDAHGPTALASVSPLIDPAAGETRYYQATTAKFAGIVDASGAWLYRQSSYLRLED
ncbi:hypothetical protein ATK74_2679 [Propionicimonas paludicola]|uniref:WG repeat protein n=1 Tax=Propionicimonas paludicola TaxID=185243 RepID=A0A2A9CWZ7_9ACTN|nr:hypothetical protein ATK74_2679 [Propionicimonas paludicola]